MRNKAFHSAIRKLVCSPSCRHVLDIGAGTGLLSMMACRARALGRPVEENGFTVTACESYLPVYQIARRILSRNNMDSSISLFNLRSDEMEVGVHLPSRADALVCEILDSELLGEGVIPTLRHAHQHLLRPGACVVPYRATVYAQLVECEFFWRCHDLKNVESELSDGLILVPPGYEESSYFRFSQHPMHVDVLWNEIKTLSEPFEAFSVEFHRAPEPQGAFKRSVNISRDGVAHAIISWWVLQLDQDGSIQYSTAPKTLSSGKSWTDHWRQCVWFLPGRGVSAKANTSIDVAVMHDETSVRYAIGNEMTVTKQLFSPELKMSASRIRMVGDPIRRSIVQAAIAKAVGSRRTATCLLVDDSILVASATCSNQNTRVYATFPGLKDGVLKYFKTIAEINGFNSEKLSWLQKELVQLTAEDLKDVDLILAEPYYCNYENMLPWKQLRFWHDLSVIRPLLSRNCTVLPCRGTLCGMGFSLPDLWRSRCSLNKVEGFEHTPANKFLGACGNLPEFLECPLLTFPLWQCGQHQALTNRFSLITFDMSTETQDISGAAMVHFANSGLCHGILLWMDWALDSDGTLVLSTGPSEEGKPECWKQGIYLFKSPMEVRASETSIQVEASFHAQTGDVTMAFK